MGHFLNIGTWKRREHFELYRHFANPFFNVCVDVDVTRLWAACSEPGGPSFFLATVFYALRACNQVEAFRMRVRGDGVFVHDRLSITPTVMRSDDTFGFARLELAPSLKEFEVANQPVLECAREIKPLVLTHPDDDLIYHSTLPWFRFTAFANALNGNADSVPRVVFGKRSQDGGAWKMPVGVEVHHAVVDGLDVARFYELFQTGLTDLD
jgi:chloramphenicol O-acetyltransferase type A